MNLVCANGNYNDNYKCAKLCRELGCEDEVGETKVEDTVRVDYKDMYCMLIVCRDKGE